jgi:hypothetical protein
MWAIGISEREESVVVQKMQTQTLLWILQGIRNWGTYSEVRRQY